MTSLRQDQLKLVQSYALYYGYGEREKLARFDLVIIEPKACHEDDLRYLQTKKTLVLSYLSVMEVQPTDAIFPTLQTEDFLLVDGRPLMNDVFGTYYVNLTSRRWQAYLKKETDYRLHTIRSDGLFLDTIGGLEHPVLTKEQREEQVTAALDWLKWVKQHYPDHLLIQNNGLETLCLQTAPYINGILWENPPLTLPESQAWVDVIFRQLEALSHSFDLRLFLLFEETVERERQSYPKAKRLAKKKPYLVYNAPENYVKGVNLY